MKRILLLVTLALMLASAMALSGVAQAAPISGKADAQCAKLAIKTLGPSFNPSTYTFIGGTEGDDALNYPDLGTGGPYVFCGFGGGDSIETLRGGDIFLGGAGNDVVLGNNQGIFYGQEGDDSVLNNQGTVYGGAGNDFVQNNRGTFDGGEGTDLVQRNFGGCLINVEFGDVGGLPC
jgi:opacity protein-like surface antigen